MGVEGYLVTTKVANTVGEWNLGYYHITVLFKNPCFLNFIDLKFTQGFKTRTLIRGGSGVQYPTDFKGNSSGRTIRY